MQRLVLTLFITAALAGCASDSDSDAPDGGFVPVAATPSFNSTQPAVVTGLEFVAQLTHNGSAYPSGSGIWPYGDYVFGSGLGAGFFIADVSDPTNPVLLYDEPDEGITIFSRDADVIAHPDGRLSLVLATQSNGMHLWDVSDPTDPRPASIVSDIGPNHNVAVVPGTELVFNSQSGGLGRSNELIDASDPYNPVVLGAYGDHGCHDITYFGSLGSTKFRAYCAGIQRTEIWDLDGLDPTAQNFGITVRGVVEFGPESPWIGNPALQSYPIRTLHHLAMVNEDASILIIGDEQNGGGTPGGCIVNADGSISSPTGALWFYDLSDETNPQLLSWLSAGLVEPTVTPTAPDPTTWDPTNPATITGQYTSGVPNCTAHFGTLVPGEEKLVMAWYSAGVVLIDFSDPARPMIIDQEQPDPTNPWDARIHNGYVFTGDIVRGMDVLRLI